MKNLFQLLHESHQVAAFALIALICNIAKTVCVPTKVFWYFFFMFFLFMFFLCVFLEGFFEIRIFHFL